MSGCADVCIWGDGYDGVNAFYEEKTLRARSAHTCCECLVEIRRGDDYQRATGKNEGGFFREATCLLCVEVRSAFVCDSWIFGDLWSEVEAQLFPVWKKNGPWDCLAKLKTQAAVDECMHRFNEWLQELEG